MAMISALMSAFNNDTLEDWVIMHTYADMLNTVSCPFRILRSMGEYEYALSREKLLREGIYKYFSSRWGIADNRGLSQASV